MSTTTTTRPAAATRPPAGSSPRSPGRPAAASCSSCATGSMTGSAWARSSTARPGCADWRRGRSRSAAAPTSTSAARRAPAGTAAATPSTRAFVLWADCDGEDAVAALRGLRAGAVDRDRVGHRQQLPRLLAAHRAARRARRSSARTVASRTRSAPTPRPPMPRGSSGSPSTLSHKHDAADAGRGDPSRRRAARERGRRRRVAARPAGASARDGPCRPSIGAMTRCWRSHRTSTCGDCSASRSRATARCPARSTRTGMQACMSTRRPSAAGTASARCRRGGTIYDLAAPLYGYTRPRRGLPAAARRAAPPLRTRGRVMTDAPARTTSSTSTPTSRPG